MRRTFLGWICLVVSCALSAPQLTAHAGPAIGDAVRPSSAAQGYAQHVLSTGDHQGMPFAIVDKIASMIWIYRADGSLVGTSSVLLGQTKGDTIMPGTGERTQSRRLRLDDRTTPAGRFISEPGHNEAGEAIVWIDYDAALAIHRLRPSPLPERRAQRLASSNPLDKRISAGCVVVPEAFFLNVVQPILGQRKGVVYVSTEDGQLPT